MKKTWLDTIVQAIRNAQQDKLKVGAMEMSDLLEMVHEIESLRAQNEALNKELEVVCSNNKLLIEQNTLLTEAMNVYKKRASAAEYTIKNGIEKDCDWSNTQAARVKTIVEQYGRDVR